jgi:hypothetical protein
MGSLDLPYIVEISCRHIRLLPIGVNDCFTILIWYTQGGVLSAAIMHFSALAFIGTYKQCWASDTIYLDIPRYLPAKTAQVPRYLDVSSPK